MAFFSHALAPSDTTSVRDTDTDTDTDTDAPRPGVFTRFIQALQVSRQRQAEREIALYLKRTGNKFTDSAEREIERRFLAREPR
jgi:hypothetical protein